MRDPLRPSRALTTLRDGLGVPMCLTLAAVLSLTVWGTDMTYFFVIYFVALASYLEFVRRLLQFRPFTKREVAGLFAVGLTMRLVFLGLPPSLSTDVIAYFMQIKGFGTGFVPNVGNFFGFPPAFAYLLKFLVLLHIDVLAFRGLVIIADVLVAYLIRLLTKNIWHSAKAANVAAVAYLFFPPAIIESGWNGHFEPLVNSVALFALILATQQKRIRAGIGTAIAIGLKAYPALFAVSELVLLERRSWTKFALALISTLSLAVAPLAYYGGTRALASMVSILTVEAGIGGAGTSLPPLYQGGIFQYLAESSIALAQYTQLVSIAVIGVCLLITVNVTRWRGRIALVLLLWLGALAALYGCLRLVASSTVTNSITAYWFVPPALTYPLVALLVAAGGLLILASIPLRAEKSSIGLVLMVSCLAGAILVMNLGALEGWYIFWFVPLVFLLVPRRYVLALIMLSLILYSAPYASSNFQSIGTAANTVSILPSTLEYTMINHLGPDFSADGLNIGWMKTSVSANQGEIKLVGERACFTTNSPYTYSFYSVSVNVDPTQYPFMLVNGNSSLTSFRFEFWNNSIPITYWVPESPKDPQYIDTTLLIGNMGFNRLVIVYLRPPGQSQCLDDLKFLPPGSANTVTAFTTGTSLALEFNSENATAGGNECVVTLCGDAGLVMNVTHPAGSFDILTINLESNYNAILEIDAQYRDSQHHEGYAILSRELRPIERFYTLTPTSVSLWEVRNTTIVSIIIKAYPSDFPSPTHLVLVRLLQFSEYNLRPNIVTFVGGASALCAVFTVITPLFTKDPEDLRDDFDLYPP